MKYLLLLLGLLLGVCPAMPVQAQPKKHTLQWHGQSFFTLTTANGTKIVFDPHAIAEFGRQTTQADIILLSHLHSDHTQVDAVENAAKAKVVQGLKERGRGWNFVNFSQKDVKIRNVGTYHDAEEGMQRGLNSVFVVEADGVRFVHLGDLGHELTPEQIKAIGPVDVLMIPVGGIYTINGSTARKVVAQLKPRWYIVPMHCGVRGYEDLLPVDEFLHPKRRSEFPQLKKLEIPVGAPAPQEPSIVLLDWEQN